MCFTHLSLTQQILYTSVSDVLAADAQLAREIEFDLRKFSEERAAAAQQRRGSTMPTAPLLPGVCTWCSEVYRAATSFMCR